MFPGFFASFDLQHVSNPAYNQQRGPVWIPSLRLHFEVGKNTFKHRLHCGVPFLYSTRGSVTAFSIGLSISDRAPTVREWDCLVTFSLQQPLVD